MCFVTEDGKFSIDQSGLAPTDTMEGSQSGSAIVYDSSIGQHCYGTHHRAPMTDTSSFGLAMGICIIAVHLDVRPFLCSTILSATAPCVRSLPDAVTLQSLLCSMATSLVRLGNPRYCCSFLGMLICDVPVSITMLARGKCSQQSSCPYKRNTSSVRVLAPISHDLLIRPCFLYVRLLREDVGRCTFASHCTPAFLPDACHHRTLHHCWLRSTGEGESFLPLLLLLSCSPLLSFKVLFSLLTPRF